MATYSQIKNVLDEIASKNARNRRYIESAKTQLTTAKTNLSAMVSDYSAIVSDINQAAIDNPSDEAYLLAKSEKDKLVADFQNLKTYAEALIVAYESVTE